MEVDLEHYQLGVMDDQQACISLIGVLSRNALHVDRELDKEMAQLHQVDLRALVYLA